jgi:hypothetical protein
MREQQGYITRLHHKVTSQGYITCAVATANGFAMPYWTTPGSPLEESAIYRKKPTSQALALAVARHGEQETGNRGILGHT